MLKDQKNSEDKYDTALLRNYGYSFFNPTLPLLPGLIPTKRETQSSVHTLFLQTSVCVIVSIGDAELKLYIYIYTWTPSSGLTAVANREIYIDVCIRKVQSTCLFLRNIRGICRRCSCSFTNSRCKF